MVEGSVWTLINGWKFQFTPPVGRSPLAPSKGELLFPDGQVFDTIEQRQEDINVMFNLVLQNNRSTIENKIVEDPNRKSPTAFFGGVDGFKAIYMGENLWENNIFDPNVVIDVKGPQPPVIIEASYQITGRVGEKETENPLEKVKISWTNTTSSIIDGVRTPEEGIEEETFTDIEGNYTLNIILPIDETTGKVADESKSSPNISFSKEEYSQKLVDVRAGDGTVLSNIPIVLMKPKLQDLREEQNKYGNVGNKQVKQIKNQVPKDPKAFLIKKIMKMVKTIKNQIIFLLLGMLYEFGMSKIEEGIAEGKDMLEDARCVPNPRLLEMIRLKNKLTRQLNNIYNLIDRAVKYVGIATGLLAAFKLIIRIIRFLPIPTSVPPGIGIPLSVINKFQELLDKFSKKIAQFTQISTGILAALIILREVLKQAIALLDMLDQLIGKCAEENGGEFVDENGQVINFSEIPQVELDAELLASLEDQENDGTPGPPYLVNGFILEVQTDNLNPVGSLKRRYAVAKNRQGVILLEGEKSFSSNDQILINELKFYIQSNDLKAF
tara:strand:- start:685 stop:2340 length:1656 start_codon:yes stop_codon:yes gene_type:complete